MNNLRPINIMCGARVEKSAWFHQFVTINGEEGVEVHAIIEDCDGTVMLFNIKSYTLNFPDRGTSNGKINCKDRRYDCLYFNDNTRSCGLGLIWSNSKGKCTTYHKKSE